jgi:hypothetical protein
LAVCLIKDKNKIKTFFRGLILCLVAASLASCVSFREKPSDEKFAIILQAGKESHEGMARAVHALLYSMELQESGHEVVLIVDGAGTEWAEELTDPNSTNKLKPMYDKFEATGVTTIACDYCAGAFGVKDKLESRQCPLVAEYEGHPSIAKWVKKGYQLVVL